MWRLNPIQKRWFDLVWVMTEKEFLIRYKYTVLGLLWLIINPFLQMLVIGFVFTYFIKEPMENYYYYLFSGLLVWNFFSSSLSRATSSLISERLLIKKSSFPKEIIPISVVISNFINLLAAYVLFLIPTYFVGLLSWYKIPQVMFGFLLLFIFTTGISLLTSSLNVKYRDVNFFVQALLMVWFYATPVMYSLSIIPTKIIWLWYFNPMTSIIQLFQSTFLNIPGPDLLTLLLNIVVIVGMAIIGYVFFIKSSCDFDDLL